MLSVFISHSSKDKPFVRELADFLETDGDIQVWLDEREIAPGENIVSRIENGLDSDFILLILSPDSVESNWVREEWTDAFWEQTNQRETKLAGVLYRDQDSLQRSYGNQALILQAWGQLVEALALHKKQEALCREMGNKRDLGYCYWQWGSLAKTSDNSEEEQKKLRAALALFTELQMPRERDAVAAELAKAQPAGTS